MTSNLSTAGRLEGPGPAGPTMSAMAQRRYGPAGDVRNLEQVPRPTVGADEVLVRVRAAGVDRGVWHVVTGLPYPIRLAGFGLRAPKAPTPGMDVAGVVVAVGDDYLVAGRARGKVVVTM